MFVVLVICCFLGIVVLPVIFLLDPLEVKTKAAQTVSGSRPSTAADVLRLQPAEDGHAAASGAK